MKELSRRNIVLCNYRELIINSLFKLESKSLRMSVDDINAVFEHVVEEYCVRADAVELQILVQAMRTYALSVKED